MKSIISKLILWWKSETPIISRFFQAICVAFVFLPTYFNTLPAQFQAAFTTEEIRITAILAVIAGVLLNFTTKKTSK
jgi:hypothetical protein